MTSIYHFGETIAVKWKKVIRVNLLIYLYFKDDLILLS